MLLALSVRVIGQKVRFERAARYADAKTSLRFWLEAAKAARWNSLEDIWRTFPATDLVGHLAVFNIKGNSYRLIVHVVFGKQKLFIEEFPTHAEYSKERWKKWLYR
jgi:mRNA interferase HigB